VAAFLKQHEYTIAEYAADKWKAVLLIRFLVDVIASKPTAPPTAAPACVLPHVDGSGRAILCPVCDPAPETPRVSPERVSDADVARIVARTPVEFECDATAYENLALDLRDARAQLAEAQRERDQIKRTYETALDIIEADGIKLLAATVREKNQTKAAEARERQAEAALRDAHEQFKAIARSCDTLSPQEILNHCSIGLGERPWIKYEDAREGFGTKVDPNKSLVERERELRDLREKVRGWAEVIHAQGRTDMARMANLRVIAEMRAAAEKGASA